LSARRITELKEIAMPLQKIQERFQATTYEQAAAQFAAQIKSKHWHNCVSGDISQWQIGPNKYTILALDVQGVAASKGLPTVNLPGWFSVTAN